MGLAGTTNWSFFETPNWVDKSKHPGCTSQSKVYPPSYLKSILTLDFFILSPNLIWFCIAVLDYLVFPYNFDEAKTLTNFKWIFLRLQVNSWIYFSYCGFWHIALYWWNWGERPFNKTRDWRWGKVLHNMWYSFLGVVQWTIWEAIFMHCYATGRLPYMKDYEIFASPRNTIWFVLGCLVIPLYRSLHFYLAHRFIHIGPLYRFVHSLHHRNTDVEPFAGLSMHPIEHLLYYSCLGPSLYIWGSPFHFMWNAVHLSISPSASHSGWEDHFQSDQFHYLHHRFFECNYGTGDVPFDQWFGTFRDKMSIQGSTYKGNAEIVTKKAAITLDSKADLFGLPTKDTLFYYILICPLYLYVIHKIIDAEGKIEDPNTLAFLASVGPILATILILITRLKRNQTLHRSLFYPFHKESLLGVFGLNVLFSVLVTVIPVYHTIQMLCSKPGKSIYFTIYC